MKKYINLKGGALIKLMIFTALSKTLKNETSIF